MLDFMDVAGGPTETLVPLGDDGITIHTMVARSTTGGFIAVEELLADDHWALRLRHSQDGVAFSEPFHTVIEAGSFVEGAVNYPVLTGTDNMGGLIDPSEFYVVGSSHVSDPFGIARVPVRCEEPTR